eukprot:122634_1
MVLANENLACGLRYIDAVYKYRCPEYMRNVMVLWNDNINIQQIGIVMYRYVKCKKGYSFATIQSHEESRKWPKMKQLSIGSDCAVSFDMHGGNCNGTCCLEIPCNSLVEHNMNNYLMGARQVNGAGKGGKHMVCERHLKLSDSQWRITFLFRELRVENVEMAKEHYNKCHNNDYEWIHFFQIGLLQHHHLQLILLS